ncbi:MAG: ATP-binding protein [Pseudomonadota bacterium]
MGLLRTTHGRIALAVVALLGLGLAVLPSVERLFLLRAGDQVQASLHLTVESLRGALQRFEPLPTLIGERPNLKEYLDDPTNAALQAQINEELRLTADAIEASDVYLLDMTGLTIASSNYRKERSFLGQRFEFRPYFKEAAAGGLGRYFALGTTSMERGYFYAAPIWDQGMVFGVLTLKFTVDRFEDAWRGGSADVLVSDLSDIVFMASRPDWLFRTLSVLDDEALADVAETQQYPLDQLVPLANETGPLADGLSLMRIDEDGTTARYVKASTVLYDVGWRVRVLTPAAPAQAQAFIAYGLFALTVLFLGLVTAILIQRRTRIYDRLEEQRAAQDLLEQRVVERTSDLNAANANLLTEIEERKAAEDRLRKTQTELVQAGKLAALGQMAAALSHEINQPLAAVKTYAENAATFIDREGYSDARENVSRISKMADRISAISGHLRNFARRPRENVRAVDVVHAIDDALALMETRLQSSGAFVNYERPDTPSWVRGGHLRLQQVVVNLISNALDAMDGSKHPSLTIRVTERGAGRTMVEVADEGPGLTDETIAAMFDPFFTTKSPGKGLGLGLSISYNIVEDFGGHMSARNGDEGGAVLSLDLETAEAPDLAAAKLAASPSTAPSGIAAE